MASQDLITDRTMTDARSKISQLQTMISRSFNSKLGMLDMSSFTKQLQSSGRSLEEFRKAFSMAGAIGETAFNNTLNRLTKLDTGLISVSKTTDKLFNTIGNTVRWGIVASGFQTVLNSAHQTVQYVRDLDTSLTNIMMVTQQSKEQMNEFAQSANDAAKSLSSTTVSMTDAALVFAQQGFDTQMSEQLAQRSTQLANISQQETSVTSDQITTIMNAYDFTGNLDQIDAAMDSWANVANVSAADVEELATAAQKAASTANTTGVTLDQLNAQIATIESVTREAPENIGNALKTIYSRFADISMGETLDDGVNLGNIAETLGKVGVEVLNDEGRMNNVGDIMEQLMEVWSTLDQTQQNAISTVIAGRYQLSRFQALMNRSDLYEEYLGASQNAEGTADAMQDIYASSMEGRLNKLQATAEGIFNDIFNTDDFYGMIDALTTVLDLTNQWLDAIGGGGPLLQGLGAVATRVFSKNIAAGLTNLTYNLSASKQQKQNLAETQNLFAQNGLDIRDQKNATTLEYIQKGLAASASMTTEQQEKFNQTKEQSLQLANEQIEKERQLYQTILATNQAAKELESIDEDIITFDRDEQGRISNVDMSKYNQLVASGNLNPDDVVNKSLQGTVKLYNEVEPLQRVFNNLQGHMNNFLQGNEKIGSVKDSWTAYNRTLKSVTTALDDAGIASDELIDANKAVGDSFKGFDGTEKSIRKIVDAIENYGKKIREVRASGETGTAASNLDLGRMIGDYNETRERQKANDSYLEGQIDNFTKQDNLQKIINTTAAVGQLSFAWQSFQSLGGIWSNSDLEYGEKIFQTILNLSTTIPMLLMGVQDLSGGFIVLIQKLAMLNPAYAAATAATMAEATASTAAATADTAEAAASQAAAAGNAVEAPAATAAAAANTAEAAASTAAAGATMAFGTALKMAFPPLLAISAIITAVVAGVTALVKAYNADADAAKKASEGAQVLSESYQNLQTTYSNFEQNLDAYKTARQELSNLTEGTEEYSEALKKSNDELLKMIDLYPELAKYVTRDSDGSLIIKDSDLESFQKEQEAAIQDVKNATTVANVRADQMALTSAETSLQRQISWYGISAQGSVPFILQDSQLEEIYSLMSREGEQSVYNAEDIAELFNTDVSDPMVKAIVDSADKIVAAYGNRESTETANQIQLEEAARSALENQSGYNLEGDMAENVSAYVARQANPESELYQENLKANQALSTEDMARQYAQQMGYTYLSSDWSLNGKGGNANFLDAEGNPVNDISREVMENFLASSQSLEQAASKWSVVADQFETIANSNFSNLIGEDSNGLMEEWEAGGAISLDSLSGREQQALSDRLAQGDLTTEDLFGDIPQEEFDEWASSRGFKNGESYASSFSNGLREALDRENAFNNALDEAMSARDNFGGTNDEWFSSEDYTEKAKEILDSAEAVRELDKAYQESSLSQEDYNKGLTNMAANYSDLEDESSRVKKAVEKYNEAVEEYGEDSEEAIDASDELVEAQEDLQDKLITKEWEDAAEECEGYVDTLNNAAEDSEEYQDAAQNVADVLSDLSGIDVDSDWVTQNIGLINDWVNGVEGAGSKVRVALGASADGLSGYAQEVTGTAIDMTGALSQLHFNINGEADFSSILTALGLVDGKMLESQDQALGLASMLASIGTTHLEFEQNGELVTLDIQGLIARLEDGDESALAELNQAISAFQGGATVTGTVPAAGVPRMSDAGSGSVGNSGSSGGGGGGGGGSSYTPKKKDPIEDELDRYERVNTMLESLENQYERLNSERERLTGVEMADAMEEEIDLLNRQLSLHQQKLEIQQQEAAELKNELASQYGITFDEEGFITNYAEVHDALEKAANDAIAQYNATADEAGQEALAEQAEEAEERLKDFNDTYQRYDELWAGDLQETLNTLEDIEDQIEDIRIELMNTQLEAVDDLQDLQESMNEFNNTLKHFGEDSGLRDAELAVSNLGMFFDIANESANSLYDTLISRAQEKLNSGVLSDEERKKLQEDIAMYENARAQIGAGTIEDGGTGLFDMAFNNVGIMLDQIRQYEETGTSSIFGENSAELYASAKDAYDQAVQLLEDYEGYYMDLQEAILTMIDEQAEKIEDRREQYENINDELEHQKEIITLINGETDYENINRVLEAQQKNNAASINEMKQTIAFWQELLSNLEEGSEEWKAVNEKIVESQSALNDLVEESIEITQEKYENGVNNILDNWVTDLLGGKDLEWAADEWELINRNADYYLDDVNAAYETQKLQGKYLEMLDQTDDLRIQQMITEQMNQQLDYLREKDKLSEYDVAYANAQLEILQKRIALEEAQRNKSQMQLRRDSQGNYSYVYTADETDIASAENDLLDAQNNAYNLSKDQMIQAQDDSLSAIQDMYQMLMDIWTNASMDTEEKAARMQEVIGYFSEYFQGISEQLTESQKNLIDDFLGMADILTSENADRVSEVLKDIENGSIESFDSIDNRFSTFLADSLIDLDSFSESMAGLYADLTQQGLDYEKEIEDLDASVDENFDNMGESIDGVVKKTEQLNSTTETFVNTLNSSMETFTKYETELSNMRQQITDLENGMGAAIDEIHRLQAEIVEKDQTIAYLSGGSGSSGSGGSGGSGGGSGGSGGSGDGGNNFGGSGYSRDDLAWGIATAIWSYTNNGWGNDPVRSGKLTGAYGADFARQVQDIINRYSMTGQITDLGSGHLQFTSYNLLGYDTGGYTGSWSDGDSNAKNGKLAYLHQKELVLNATDTENILKAVDIVRQTVQTLKSSAVVDVFSNIANSISAQPSGETIEQNVHITAEFPAANSAAEIESALLSLNERAIQYSFKNR